jgi:hypothetical protein
MTQWFPGLEITQSKEESQDLRLARTLRVVEKEVLIREVGVDERGRWAIALGGGAGIPRNVGEFPSVRFLVACVLGFGCAVRGYRGAGGARAGLGAGAECGEAPRPLRLLGPLRLRCLWVWEAGSGLCGGHVRWIEPLGVPGGYVRWVGPRMEWSEGRVVLRNWEGSGMGGWEIGEGVGAWEGGTGFKPKGTATELPIYIPIPQASKLAT